MKKRKSPLFLLTIHLFLFTIYALPLRAQEPTLHQLEKAALRYSGTDPAEIRNWKARSRWSAALPRILVGYDQKIANQINNNIQDSISVSSAGVTLGPPQSTFYENDNLNRGFEMKATWELSELLFNRDSLAISAEARYRTINRSQILEELHQAYFERKKILVSTGDHKREALPALTQLHLEELEAQLDSLTGGTFSQILNGGDHEK